MKFIQCQQGTQEWLAARAGVITASCFSDAVSVLTRASGDKKVGDPTAAADKYAGDIAIERISGKPYGEPPKAWTLARGHELEPHARQGYEMATGMIAEEAGVVLTDDGEFGYSTDGLVKPFYDGETIIGCEGLIEVKCPVDSSKIRAMLATGDVSEYMHQMQGGMWITGAKWCDFIMYVPDLESVGNDLYIKRIWRDEAFIEAMAQGLMKFRKRVVEFNAIFTSMKAAVSEPKAPPAQAIIATAAIETVAPDANVVAMVRPAPAAPAVAPLTPPTLKLGQISERLGFSLTGDFLKNLGFEPAARDKSALLFHEAQFPLICMRLVAHIQAVQSTQAA